MAHRWNHVARFMALGAVCSLIIWIGTSAAQDEKSVLVLKPAATADEGPVLPPPSKPANAAKEVWPSAPPANEKQVAPPTTGNAAKPRSAMPAKRPFMRPATPKQSTVQLPPQDASPDAQLTGSEEPMPLPADAAPELQPPGDAGTPIEIQPTPPIEYDTDGDARDLYRSSGEIQMVIVTQNPADGCYYEIPICIPGCCEGDPRVESDRGIFGRGEVEYCWPCGFKVEVKFRKILGDIKVEYEGD